MTFRVNILAVVPALLLSSCLSSRPESDSLNEVSAAIQATPRYQQAKRFDAFVKNELSSDDKSDLLKDCRSNPGDNIFCFSALRETKLRAFLKKEAKAAEPHMRKVIEPITPEVEKGKVKNWGRIQKENLKGLLAGMRAYSLDDLKTIGDYALKRAECPNNIAISAAALLEMHLPFENLSERIAKLYEKGARCTRKGTPNHEHFMTRAALFLFLERKYEMAEKLLTKVQPADAYSGRSLYWLYKVRLKMGKKEDAAKTLARLKNQFPLSFHALMIQATEDFDPIAPGEAGAVPTRSRDKQANILIEQAETLREMGFSGSAAKIVTFALANFSPDEPGVRAYLSTLGDAPVQIRVVNGLLLTRPNMRNMTYFQLAYPRTYFDLMEAQSSIDPYLLMAIARKESTLDPNAVSVANAQGLLQMHPDTAKRYSNDPNLNLFDSRTNAELAARYMRELKSAMKGQLPLMIASYNAGEATVATWTQRYPTTDLLLFIDLIPYRETRDYVGFVLSNYFWYRRLYSENAKSALAALTSGELAKVEEPRGVRSIKSVIDETVRTSESWPDDNSPSPFMNKWNQSEPEEGLPDPAMGGDH